MTRESNGDVVRLSVQSWAAIAGVAVIVIGGLIAIRTEQASIRATVEAMQKQCDRMEARIR